MNEREKYVEAVETSFNNLFGGHDEPLPASLMRTAAKTIALSYPDNRHRSEAILRIIDAAGHLKLAKAITGRELSWAIFPNDDETVTLTVFENDKSASIELNEASLRQLIEILKFHAT